MKGQLYIIITAFLATILSTMVGFGSKVLLIAVLTLFIGIKEAIFVAALFSIIEYSLKSSYFFRHLDKARAARLCTYMIPGVVFGLFIFKFINVALLQMIFSLFLLAYIPYSLIEVKVKPKLNQFWVAIIMFLFGLFESVLGSGGPLLASFLLYRGHRKHQYIALASVLFLISGVIRIFGYHLLGTFEVEYILMVYLLIVSAAGIYIGEKLLERLPTKVFTYIILLVLLLVSIKNLF
jgi:uncharacterized protein